jgi:dienelactone hydrolase
MSGTKNLRLIIACSLIALVCQGCAYADEPCPVRNLPAPSGKYAVGTVILPVQDFAGTHRQVQLWYPSISPSHAKAAAYIPDPGILAALKSEKFLSLPDCVFDFWGAMSLSARVDGPLATVSSAPLIMIAPGAGVSRISYTYYAGQLASDGYVVASLDFGEGGFLVHDSKLLREGTEPKDESDYGKQASQMAAHMSDVLDQFFSKSKRIESPLVADIVARIDHDRIAVVGHSLGGAAALDLCLSDHRVRACVDLDGIPESPIAEQGIKTSALMLRSQPDYSDADLQKLHRDPATWRAKGEKIKAETAKLLSAPGPDAWIISVHGTGHMSYSDAPFTMPTTLTQFGGTYLDAQRILTITVSIVERYLQHAFAGSKFSIDSFPEATIQASRTSH